MQADFSRRRVYDAGPDGIQLSTLQYRAPELLFGNMRFGIPVDSWSVGIMMSELAGYFFTEKEATAQKALKAILQQMGTPVAPSWPEFHWHYKHYKQPWPASVHLSLGLEGVKLLEKFLSIVPENRTVDARTQQ
jgi:serine/threonine protein kinase